MNKIESIISGGVEFPEGEEYLRFQFRLLYALLWLGILFSGLFILADRFSVNHLATQHVNNNIFYFIYCIALALALHGHKERFLAIAWLAEIGSMLIYLSALILVPDDPMRILWYYINLPAVYILLGRPAGVGITLVSFGCIFEANSHISSPYNANELTTVILTFTYASVFFYAYSSRAYRFYLGMTEANRKLRELAATDPLTGLMNARAYYAACGRHISGANRTAQPYSVMFIDLDHFKRINDTYGHEAGDIVLRETADCLKRNIRHSDLLGRIGGEEFSVFLPNTDLQGAMALAEKVRNEVAMLHPRLDGTRLTITASIGVARNLPQHHTIEDIQREADQAMYRAKQQGRNRVTSLQQQA
ncbi:MAG TPA: GGDEF domain-containing protein [Sideroxyarcus sp.]|nr:GGDEF domain-containing protein [Sideroxyarcus sp.]